MRREHDRKILRASSHLLEINFAVAETIDTPIALAPSPPDGGLDARHQFARAEWLGDVVIGAKFEKKDFVHDFSDCAEDNHRSVTGEDFMVWQSSRPEIWGRMRSRTTATGRCDAKSSRPVLPSPATSMNSSPRRRCA